MRRSRINSALREAQAAFAAAGWALPPEPRWDVTDFGLGRFDQKGLVLVNLAEEPEYCEKLMFARRDQHTPAHCHGRKKEDIIVRRGTLRVQVWRDAPGAAGGRTVGAVLLRVNGRERAVESGATVDLSAGERVTLPPGVFHEFWPLSETCVLGEVSTANDDAGDNTFADPAIGRFPAIDEDEPKLAPLLGDPPTS